MTIVTIMDKIIDKRMAFYDKQIECLTSKRRVALLLRNYDFCGIGSINQRNSEVQLIFKIRNLDRYSGEFFEVNLVELLDVNAEEYLDFETMTLYYIL